jgi:hypothetical protein
MIINTFASLLCVRPDMPTRDILDQTFSRLFSQYLGSASNDKNTIINMMIENLEYYFPGGGIQALVDAYYSNREWGLAAYGLEIGTTIFEATGYAVYYITP